MISLKNIFIYLLFIFIIFNLVSCNSDDEVDEPVILWEEAPLLETPLDFIDDLDDDPWTPVEEIDLSYMLNLTAEATRWTAPIGEWFSVHDGLFMRALISHDEVYLSIQNQSIFRNVETILVLSYDEDDKYAFFIPYNLIPPYDYQTDFVATAIELLEPLNNFRVLVQDDHDWEQLELLVDYTETYLFLRVMRGFRGTPSSVRQTRHRYTFYDFDFSELEPEIRWTPRIDDDGTGYQDLVLDVGLHPGGGIIYRPPGVTEGVITQDLYDLLLHPTVVYAGLRFTNIMFSSITLSIEGYVENILNEGISQNVVFELLSDDFTSLGTITFGPIIPEVGESDRFRIPISPGMVNARFIRVV